MKRNPFCGALGGIAFLHFGAFAETGKPNATATSGVATSAPSKPIERKEPKRIATMNGEPIKKQ